MSIVGIIATVINIICTAINTIWAVYWIKRLEKSLQQDKGEP